MDEVRARLAVERVRQTSVWLDKRLAVKHVLQHLRGVHDGRSPRGARAARARWPHGRRYGARRESASKASDPFREGVFF